MRMEKIKNGEEAPREFLFGASELIEKGYEVDLYEFDDFYADRNRIINRSLARINNFISAKTGLVSSSHLFDLESVKRLNNYDIVIAGNEYVALGLLPYIELNIIRVRAIFFVMGMLSMIEFLNPCRLPFTIARHIYKRLLRNFSRSVFLGEGEILYARRLFPGLRTKMELLNFPVDTSFWYKKGDIEEDYILFIGNDRNRDFDLLAQIARLMPMNQFRFITDRMNGYNLPSNAKIIRGDWKRMYLSDEDIRDQISNCKTVILPLKESKQPSGQSVALQAMACGKSVIISRTSGFWNYRDFVHRGNILFVESRSCKKWANSISELLTSENMRNRVGESARSLVSQKYGLKTFSKEIERIGFQ